MARRAEIPDVSPLTHLLDHYGLFRCVRFIGVKPQGQPRPVSPEHDDHARSVLVRTHLPTLQLPSFDEFDRVSCRLISRWKEVRKPTL